MNNEFVKKFETSKYEIGAYDAYQEQSKNLIQENSNLTIEETEKIVKSMPTTYRAAIQDKNNNYIGFIGLYNIDSANNIASVRYETKNDLDEKDKKEILDTYMKWVNDSLNIFNIEEQIYKSNNQIQEVKNKIVRRNAIVKSKYLTPGVSEEVLSKYMQMYNNKIPKMSCPFTIVNGNKAIGIIGLTNLIWSNRRANLNLFLDKDLPQDIAIEFGSYIVDDYVAFLHEYNLYNISTSISGSNEKMKNIMKESKMNFYAAIPFGVQSNGNIESNLLYQHIPTMEKTSHQVPSNIILPDNVIKAKKDTLSEIVELGNGFRLISPKVLEKENIDVNEIINGQIKAQQERDKFSIPLGEDKYILQKGNINYGITKQVQNYSYIVIDENNDYTGYINILRTNANFKNAEIEIGIKPSAQHKGLGKLVAEAFYNELFSIGYASVTSTVFEFNNPSIKLHEKIAEFNGIRLNSYYINGNLWNMNYYTKVNPDIRIVR